MKRPTLRDIADIAKVSHVAVSLALRKHPSISKKTRERIAEIAKQIGYRPDPALQALMAYRRGAKPSSYQGTLAWINNHRAKPDNLKSHFPNYYLGAQERAVELGYQLEEFRLVDLNMDFGRLSSVLQSRNIQGLIFPPQEGQRHISQKSFDWEKFSLIAFGFSLMRPRIDAVVNSMFNSARTAVRKLRSLGYRRIGFAIETLSNERTGQNFLAGFLIEQRRFSAAETVPILLLPKSSELKSEQVFRKWFKQNKPDAVLSVSHIVASWFQALGDSRRGCGLALMDLPDNNTEISGILQNNRIVGRTAVDILVSKIHMNERDIPVTPRVTLIEGTWIAGTTAPRVSGAGKSA